MAIKAFIALSETLVLFFFFFENLKFLVVVFRLKVNFGYIILGKTSKMNRSKFRVEASELKQVYRVVLAFTKPSMRVFCLSLTFLQLVF